MGRPRFLKPDLPQPHGHLAHSSHKRTCGLVIRRVASAGIRRVHDRYITSPRQVHDRLNQIQSLRRDAGKPSCGMTPPLAHTRPDPRAASLATAPRQSSTGGRRRALGHCLRGSLDDMARADPSACSGRRNEQDQPAARLSRTAENRPPGMHGMHGMHQSDEQSGCPCNGTKRARIGKANGSTDRSSGPDAVRHMSVTIATQ
jgi:hypothetical protein